MVGVHNLPMFIAAGLLLAMSPGPDTAYVLGRSAQSGWRGGMVAAIGIAVGIWVHILAAAIGLSALLMTSARAFMVTKLVGAAYLVFLGLKMIASTGQRRDFAMGRTPSSTPTNGFVLGKRLVGFIAATSGILLFTPDTLVGRRADHPYRYSDVDMPVSLAIGTVRTPEFPVVPLWYDIMIQVEKPLPFRQMQCMMGATTGPLALKDCTSDDPLLQAEWTVRDGDHVVDQGTVPNRCACMFENKHIFKFLGGFGGEAGKKYVVEVKFTKDGRPLNVANPHLIVIKHKLN